MSSNPYGASCGTSIVVSPRQVRVSLGKLGTPSARLSDTASGKSPKRIKTREEVEAMEREKTDHRITVIRPAQPPCTCKECKEDEVLLAEMDKNADDLLAIVHARIQRNNEEEARSKTGKEQSINLYLQARGDMDS